MSKQVKIALRAVLCILLAIILVVLSYVAYVFLSYSRIEDNVKLSPSGKGTISVKTGVTYTAVTQNIGFGAYEQDYTFFMDGGVESRARSKEAVLKNTEGAMQAIESANHDFVFVQEVDFDSTRSYHVDQSDILTKRFASFSNAFAVNYHSAYLFFPILEPHGASNSGILTLSKAEITSSMRRQLPISTSVSKILDLDRCYSVSRVSVENGKELVLYNVHMSAYGGSDEIRASQMGMLFADMKGEYDKGNYVVCGGDYNHDFTGDSTLVLNGVASTDYGWAQPFPTDLLAKYPGISRAMNYTSGKQEPTCRDCDVPYKLGNTVFIVDGFLVSDNVEVTSLVNVQKQFVYSDHNPVVMQFHLK